MSEKEQRAHRIPSILEQSFLITRKEFGGVVLPEPQEQEVEESQDTLSDAGPGASQVDES